MRSRSSTSPRTTPSTRTCSRAARPRRARRPTRAAPPSGGASSTAPPQSGRSTRSGCSTTRTAAPRCGASSRHGCPSTPTNTQPANSPAWNYIYARQTGSTCDMTIANNVTGNSRLYVAGNLCLDNNAGITSESLIVRGHLDLGNNAYVGTSSSMATRVETYVGGSCRYGGGTWGTPCSGNQDTRRLYSKRNGPSYVVGVNNTAPIVPEPAANFATWYENAIPGPSQGCTTQQRDAADLRHQLSDPQQQRRLVQPDPRRAPTRAVSGRPAPRAASFPGTTPRRRSPSPARSSSTAARTSRTAR